MIYVYEAIKRPKENSDMSGIRFVRHVRYIEKQSEEEAVFILKNKISTLPGVWRIYRSVNQRDERKAKLELATTLIKQLTYPASVSDKGPESLWKDILMQPHNKSERIFLVDLDSNDEELALRILVKPEITVLEKTRSPNGWHLLCQPFDPRLIADIPEASIHKDALVYLSTVTVSK